MTELEAINVLLGNIGTSPVNSLNTGHPDATAAEKTLNRWRERIQRRGWWFNVDYQVTLQREPVTNKIPVLNVVSAELPDQTIVKRGDYLYNRVTQSYIFTEDAFAQRVIRYVVWDDLPDVAQEFALNLAGAEFVRDEIEDTNKQLSLEQSAELARQELVAQDLREQNFNSFDKSRVARARGGVRPYGRGTARFYGTPDA